MGDCSNPWKMIWLTVKGWVYRQTELGMMEANTEYSVAVYLIITEWGFFRTINECVVLGA